MTQNPNEIFALAHRHFAAGDSASCLSLLDKLESSVGAHWSIEHLRALSEAQTGNVQAAGKHFELAVSMSGDKPDPALLANFARMLWAERQFDEARNMLHRAAGLAPDDAAIQAMHVTAIRRADGDDAASSAFDKLTASQPNSAPLWHYKSLFLRDAGRHDPALDAIRHALAANPASANAQQLEARILLDLGLKSSDKFAQYVRAHPDDQDALCGWAASLVHEGRTEAALEQLDRGIERHPDFYRAIDTRLRITTQTQDLAKARDWLNGLIGRYGPDAELARMLTHLVWRTEGAGAALAIAPAMTSAASIPDIVQHAELSSEAGDLAEADRLFGKLEGSLSAAPPALRMALVRHRFRISETEQATKLAHEIATRTHLIEAWAYVEAGWRMLKDQRWDWLTGEGQLVRPFELEHFASYHGALCRDLAVLHDQILNQPFEQSVRGGTQTDGFLLGRREDSIRSLRQDIDAAIATYISALPALGTEHPLARLQGSQHRIIGSWSVRLRDAGHHASHFHNDGLLSSACYISLPESMAGDAAVEGQEGWIEFGRPPDTSGIDLEPFQTVQPREGRLVLFPSFMFHGTRSFREGERMTVAFDVADIRL